ncbi:hypothetical protein FBZ93_1309 [Bradyrhizobium macuxiense]|uniref:Uncharacterized protein n=1 Tax=Bradyrhizobium macuxiense TaxID=1755647 RepID=A0A560KS34_9BRAD|nr:hypothetical protein FBZ93_1309 [Bradyrhizobium macuxiense]
MWMCVEAPDFLNSFQKLSTWFVWRVASWR